MGTLSMKIFKAATLQLLLNDFISFFFFLFFFFQPIAPLRLCEGLRWVLIQVSPRRSRPKEQLEQDKNTIVGRRAPTVSNWCHLIARAGERQKMGRVQMEYHEAKRLCVRWFQFLLDLYMRGWGCVVCDVRWGRTGVQQRRACWDVDFLQELQRFSMEETNGRALGERHPHASTGARHVRHADHRVWMDFKLL